MKSMKVPKQRRVLGYFVCDRNRSHKWDWYEGSPNLSGEMCHQCVGHYGSTILHEVKPIRRTKKAGKK